MLFSDYIDVTTTKTHDAYVGTPLATHSATARGDILERVAKRVMEEKMGETACAPASGTCVNGAKRGRNQETYDFGIANRRVEVKSAQLTWNTHKRLWVAMWCNIKRDAYDDLFLVLYTPCGVHIFKHDHVYGVSTNGVSQSSSGGCVCVFAPRNAMHISAATAALCSKLAHMHYASRAFHEFDDLITTTMTHDAYVGTPLAAHSAKARGDILERVAKRVMEEKMGETACAPASGTCVNGTKRGRNRETYDFGIANRRVEVKSSQLTWNTHLRRWEAHWRHIKRDAYDDLLLVLYTPCGVHIFKHDHVYGVSTNGVAQSSRGGKVCVFAPRNETHISAATDVLLSKLAPLHYASLAF